jgi:hypothetical protein
MSHPSRPEEGMPLEDVPFEDRPDVQQAIAADAAVPGLDGRWREPDPETCAFQEPGQPPRTYWRGPNL